jgi:3D (Asp-Asp-Asp) domain-containing protein
MFKIAALAATALAVTAPTSEAKPKVFTSTATSYCLTGTMANGKKVHKRAIAHNFLKPGTKIRLVGGDGFYGRRLYVVSDTGPALADGHFDIWSESCSRSISWGHRTIKYKLGWGKP